MSFDTPTGEDREEVLPVATFSFGPGFSIIDINTITSDPTTGTSTSFIAASSTSLSTLAEPTTLARFTRSRVSSSLDTPSSSVISTILEDVEPSSTKSIPTTRPPPISTTQSSPTFPTIVMATDIQKTASGTATGMTAPTTSDSSDNASTQPTEAASSSGISPGAAAGVAVIVVVVLVLLGFGIFRYLRQKKNQGLPPMSKSKKGKPAQMVVMPYMANERSLEEGWESGSTIAPFHFDDPDRAGLGLSGIGSGEQRHSNAGAMRLPIHR
ncbi:hypothetical protein TWF730_005103 [Orbilia blumenaviensis]|uniref:Uncharacterized protein n=1 Tax=Orbilia blumenaviensis TaxID=1796055 RepID=A0AAV9VHK4_9PEZI